MFRQGKFKSHWRTWVSDRIPSRLGRRRWRGTFEAAYEPLEERRLLVVTASLVMDINPGIGDSTPDLLVEVGEIAFFTAGDGGSGVELWKSDGTSAGTLLVKDINPGSASSSVEHLTNVNGTLFFRAHNGANGSELWKSDGTEAGTVLVKDINPGSGSSSPNYLTNVGGTLFFQASGAGGAELWKSDGTEAGTIRVKDINPGAAGSLPGRLANIGGTLFFRAATFSTNIELWKSDGTEAGTVLVKDILPGGSIGPTSDIAQLTDVGGTLFFQANDHLTGPELWKSDGTESGTQLVKDIKPGSLGSSLMNLTNVSGVLYFRANDGMNGVELWRSDGTEAGTVMVKDINPGSGFSTPTSHPMVNIGGTLFFRANDGTGHNLWKSDGTEAGTVLVKDLVVPPDQLTNVNGTLLFTNGLELWKSDGTETGTFLVQEIRPDSGFSHPDNLTNVAGTLFFNADDGVHGRELWKTEINNLPALAAIDNQLVGEGSWSFVVWATDPDAGDALTFRLGADVPVGMTITPGPEAREATISWNVSDDLQVSPNPFSLEIIVTDNGAGSLSDSKTIQITVQNTAPAASVFGAQITRTGISQSFSLTAHDLSSVDQAAGFTFDIDWDGNGTFDERVIGSSGTLVGHAFNTVGSYSVGVRATDKDGGQSTVFSLPVHVWQVSQPGGDVLWEGSGGNDMVEFEETEAGQVQVRTLQVGGIATNDIENFSGVIGLVRGYGHHGRDRLDASKLYSISAYFEGGFGNDTLIGGGANDTIKGEFDGAAGDGAEGNDWIEGRGGNDLLIGDGAEGGSDTILGGDGNDVIRGDGGDGLEGRADSLLGGNGNDQIFGHTGNDFIDGGADDDLLMGGRDGSEGNDTIISGSGNDILIGSNGADRLVGTGGMNILLGGKGADTLIAGGGGDLLVSDTTDYDQNPAGLTAIRNEWISGGSYSIRINNIRTGGGLNSDNTLNVGTSVVDDEAIDHLLGNDQIELNWYIYNFAFDQITDYDPSETADDTHGSLP